MTDVQSDVAPNELEGDATPTIAPFEVAGWVTLPVAPWRRYGARVLDFVTSGGLGMVVFGIAFAVVAPISADNFFSLFDGSFGRIFDLFFTLIVASLINAILIATVGTTIGKAIFGIRVRKPDLSGLGFAGSFVRESKVWVFGLGLGIPIIMLIAHIIGYNKLKSEGQSSWDKGRNLVMYRQVGGFQTIMNVIGIALIIAGRLGLIALSKM